MEYNDLKALASAAMKAEKNAAVAYSYGDENFSTEQVNEALRAEFSKLAGSYADFRENKAKIFRLVEETIDEVLPRKVEQQYEQFAEVKTVAQGDKAIYRIKISEAAKKRAKSFVTAVGLAGRYEVFMLDGTTLEVETKAIGGAARIGFEEFLDGRIQFSDLTNIVLEGMDEYIRKDIIAALEAAAKTLPDVNKVEFAGFDEALMDDLLSIADSYAHASIYCTLEFAAKMIPAEGWISGNMKDRMWSQGYLGDYKGHSVILLDQSMEDVTNTTKVIDPSRAYIIPTGTDKPVKIVFEGQTAVREVDNNDDWSRDMQFYKKYGVAVFQNHWMCSYRNTDLTKKVRSDLS